jgi:hypothetical protein
MTRHFTIPIVREIFPPHPSPTVPPDPAPGDSQRELVLASLIARPQDDSPRPDEV